MTRGLAYKRHQLTRRKRQVRAMIRTWAPMYGVEEFSEEWIARRASTRHPCSGICCNNKRQYEGPTIKERLLDEQDA